MTKLLRDLASLRIETILINRLILNLRSYDDEKADAHATSKTDMIFRSVVRGGGRVSVQSVSRSFLGNIGEPLSADEDIEEITALDEISANVEEEVA